MEQEQTHKKSHSFSRFWIVWGITLAAVLCGIGYFGWKTMAFNAENNRFEVSIENTSERLQALAPGTEQLIKKRGEVATRAEKFRTNWSEIMKQLTVLETQAVRFASLQATLPNIIANVQATSWNSFSAFIAALEANPSVKNIRISNTMKLSPAVAGATQSANITFDFHENQ